MAIYCLVALFTILINILPVKTQQGYSIRSFISLIPLFLFGALRLDFGLDYQGYLDFFNEAKLFGHAADERMEIGYYYLNRILPSFRSLLVLQSALLCISYFYLFKWYIPSRYAWLGFLLLFLNGPLTIYFMLSGIRNGFAISFFILSTYFIQRRKLVYFICVIFIAYLFHNSVLLMAPLAYFVASGKPITKKSSTIWVLVILFFLIASSTVILEYANIFISAYFERYVYYLDKAKDVDAGAGLLISVFSLTVSIIILLLAKNKRLLYQDNMLIRLSLLFFLSYLLGALNFRMSQYFAPFFIVASVIFMSKKYLNTKLKNTYIILILVFSMYAFKIWIDAPSFDYQTYDSILSY